MLRIFKFCSYFNVRFFFSRSANKIIYLAVGKINEKSETKYLNDKLEPNKH